MLQTSTGTNNFLQGHLSGFSLSSILSLIDRDKQSCIITIDEDVKRGVLVIQDGVALEASCYSLTEESTVFMDDEAVHTMIGWDTINLELSHLVDTIPRKRAIQSNMQELLLNGARLADEKRFHV